MANLGQTFNASEHEAWGEREKFEPVPPGRYLSQIIASEIMETRAGNGQRLVFTIDLIEGECAGRKVFDAINLANPSKAAVAVAPSSAGPGRTAPDLGAGPPRPSPRCRASRRGQNCSSPLAPSVSADVLPSPPCRPGLAIPLAKPRAAPRHGRRLWCI